MTTRSEGFASAAAREEVGSSGPARATAKAAMNGARMGGTFSSNVVVVKAERRYIPPGIATSDAGACIAWQVGTSHQRSRKTDANTSATMLTPATANKPTTDQMRTSSMPVGDALTRPTHLRNSLTPPKRMPEAARTTVDAVPWKITTMRNGVSLKVGSRAQTKANANAGQARNDTA